MKYTTGIDPHYTANLYQYDGATSLPKLDVGNHTVEVRATDMFRRKHFQQKTIEVLKQ